MKSYWEAYFSMIYVSGFLGLYEFVEVQLVSLQPRILEACITFSEIRHASL